MCNPETDVLPEQASIHRVHLDGSGDEILAKGVRNSQGFDFNPGKKPLELWFTDNGRDELGDDFPPDELNKLSTPGEFFGWPKCNGDNVDDTQFIAKGFCAKNATPPAVVLDPHAAALGMRFYRGTQFPEPYRSSIFIAEHGSWNRARKHGYQVVMGDLSGSVRRKIGGTANANCPQFAHFRRNSDRKWAADA